MTPPPLQITCKEFAELVTAHDDGVLPERDRIRFVSHGERCPGCRAYLQQFRLTVEALRSVPRETAEPENLDELARRVLNRGRSVTQAKDWPLTDRRLWASAPRKSERRSPRVPTRRRGRSRTPHRSPPRSRPAAKRKANGTCRPATW